MKNEPSVGIIIVNWNGITDTSKCVESLQKLTYGAYKIFVVDNASEHNEIQELEKLLSAEVDFIKNGDNFGFAEGNNIGMRYAKRVYNPEYFWILNNDTEVDPNSLSELVRTAQSDARIGITGSSIRYWNSTLTYCLGGGTLSLWTGYDHLVGSKKMYTTPTVSSKLSYVSGCSMLIRRDVVDRLTGFDPDYFLYSEEVDLCIRATRAGFTLAHSPASLVFHKSAQSTGYDSPRYIYYFLRNKLILMKKNARLWQYPTYILFFLFYYCCGFTWRYWIKNKRLPLSIIHKSIVDFINRRWSAQPITTS